MNAEKEKVTVTVGGKRKPLTGDTEKGYNPAQIIEGSKPQTQQPQTQRPSDKKKE